MPPKSPDTLRDEHASRVAFSINSMLLVMRQQSRDIVTDVDAEAAENVWRTLYALATAAPEFLAAPDALNPGSQTAVKIDAISAVSRVLAVPAVPAVPADDPESEKDAA